MEFLAKEEREGHFDGKISEKKHQSEGVLDSLAKVT